MLRATIKGPSAFPQGWTGRLGVTVQLVPNGLSLRLMTVRGVRKRHESVYCVITVKETSCSVPSKLHR